MENTYRTLRQQRELVILPGRGEGARPEQQLLVD